MAAKKPAAMRRASPDDGVRAAANVHCLCTYGDAYIGGTPRLLTLPSGRIWVAPVMFTSAGYGPVDEVGVVALDPKTLDILDATPAEEVRAAGARLAREKRQLLDAAFQRAKADRFARRGASAQGPDSTVD